MTIFSTNRKAGPYVGNDVTVAFPFSFKVFNASDLYVVRADSTGAETVLTLTTDYTVSLNADQNANPGGTINLPVALASGRTLTVTSSLEYLQPTDLTNNGGFYPKVITNALDRLTIFCQQLYEQIGRSLKLAISVPPGVKVTLPVPVPYQVLGWDSTGTEIVNADPTYASPLAGELSSSDTGKGSKLIAFIQRLAGTVARRVEDKLAETVSVKDFGAKGDGATDDTAAINAAIAAVPARAALFFPAGIYKVSAPLLVARSDITLYGESNTSTYILRTDGAYGDTITVASSDPDNVAISGVVIRDMRIQCNADMESGAHLHLVNVAASFFTNLTLMNGYRGFWLEGVRTSHFTTTLIQAGTYAANARAGSAYVYIGLPTTAALENTEVFFSDFNWEYSGTPRRVENGLVIRECDGIWFSNGHIFGASNADLHLLSSASSDQLLAAIFDHVWFDQQCSKNLQVSGSGALFGLCRFSSCRFTGADDYSVLVSASSSMQGLAFHGCEFGVGALDQAVDLFSGNNVSFNGCRFEQIDSDSSSTSDAYIVVRATSTLGKLAVAGCTFVGDAKLQHGILLLNGTTEYTITGNAFVDFSTVAGEEISTDRALLTGSLSGNVTDRTFNIAATAGTQYITAACSFANLTGASVNITAITPKWNGREISFRADTNTKTLQEGVEILSTSGGDITIPIGRVRRLIYSRGQDRWYQTG